MFDQRQHESVLHLSELDARSLAVYSFGKTFHATGWKIGYCRGAGHLMESSVECISSSNSASRLRCSTRWPTFSHRPRSTTRAADFYQDKRDRFHGVSPADSVSPCELPPAPTSSC